MITFAICDDEPFMLDNIASQISEYMTKKKLLFRTDCFSCGRELLKSNSSFDIIFLDIQMDEPDGMETARILRAQGCRSLLIFITVLREPVFDSFEVQAYDYLVKPLDKLRLCRTLDRAITSLNESSGQNLIIQTGNSCQVIPFSQIIYCEVLGRKIYIHRTDGRTLDHYDKMDHLENHMDSRFFRCHRSYLVNLDHVRKFDAGMIHLSDGSEIPVSRLRGQEFMKTLLLHMKDRRN